MHWLLRAEKDVKPAAAAGAGKAPVAILSGAARDPDDDIQGAIERDREYLQIKLAVCPRALRGLGWLAR